MSHSAAGCPASHRVVSVYHNGEFKVVCIGCFPHMAAFQLRGDGGVDKRGAVDAALNRLSEAVEELRNALKGEP